MIGVAGAPLYLPATETPAPWTALAYGVERMVAVIVQSLNGIRYIVTGAIGAENLQGPLGIAQISGRDRGAGASELRGADRGDLDGDRAAEPLPDPDPRRRAFRRLPDRGGARTAAEPGGDADRDVDWSWLDPATDGICNLQRHHAHGELTNRAANRPRGRGQERRWGSGCGFRAIPRLILVIAVLAVILPTPLIHAQGTAVFSRIDVAGNQRIEADTIRVFAGIEPGQPVTPEQLNLAVRNLFDTGLFEDVQVMPEAGRLVITVVENPTINQIAFEGNDSLDDEELYEVVQLRPRLAYSVPAAEADAQRIIDAYRAAGRYAAAVTPVIIRLPENRVDLVFEIIEGRVTSVQRINFTGNQVFSDRRLRRVVETNQSNWLSFIFGRATYDADRLEVDNELLRQFYLERGYIDVRVLSATAELARERTGFFLSFTVSEGQRYNFGQVSVSSSIPGLDAAAFEPLLAPVADRGVYNVAAGRPGGRAHGLPGRAGGLRLRRDPAAA